MNCRKIVSKEKQDMKVIQKTESQLQKLKKILLVSRAFTVQAYALPGPHSVLNIRLSLSYSDCQARESIISFYLTNKREDNICI